MQQSASKTKAPKRLLVVSQHFWPENFRITDIVEGFMEDDIQVDVLCGLPNYPKGEWFSGYSYTGPRRQNYKGAAVYRAGEIRRKGNTSLRIFLNYISFPICALFNLPRLRKNKYDAVFCYQTSPVYMMWPAILYAKLHRIPLITYVLDLWPDNLYSVLPLKNGLFRKLAQSSSNWCYRRSNTLIAMSEALEEQLQRLYGNSKRQITTTVIPQYCEDFYAEDIEDTALKEKYAGTFNILFAGNLSPAQDLENLVSAMKIVKSQGYHSIRSLIVGDGMSKEALQAQIEQEQLQDAFVFCGQHPPQDMPRWTGMADALFAGLAKSDNLGLTVPAKITSYFAAGRPVLVAADREAARVAQESGAALVSPAGDAEALAQNIIQLYSLSPAQRAKMGVNGRGVYQQQYCRSLLLKKLEESIFPIKP